MKRILVINPNTSAHVTDMVLASCRLAHPELQWDGATGRLGAAYISSESAYAIAAHAALDAYATHFAGHDAVLIACFGDPGLLAMREVAMAPVVGLAQASFEAAARRGPFAVVTGGKAWGPMLVGAQAAVDAALLTPALPAPLRAARSPVTGLSSALSQLLN